MKKKFIFLTLSIATLCIINSNITFANPHGMGHGPGMHNNHPMMHNNMYPHHHPNHIHSSFGIVYSNFNNCNNCCYGYVNNCNYPCNNFMQPGINVGLNFRI